MRDPSPEEAKRIGQLFLADPCGDERQDGVGRRADRGERGDRTVGSLLRFQVRDRVIDAVAVILPLRARDRGRYDERCDDSQREQGGDDPSTGPTHGQLLSGTSSRPQQIDPPAGGSSTGR